ncbi:helix-turn-helix domain-containing protein [Brucellaceae bacterium C25G]
MSFQISGVIRAEAEVLQALEEIAARRERPMQLEHLQMRSTPLKQRASDMCDGLIDLLSEWFGVSGGELRDSVRGTKDIARVRQIGMYVAHTTFGMTMSMVATGFGRDRSTVMYACHLIENMRDDCEFDQIVHNFEKIVVAAFSIEERAL